MSVQLVSTGITFPDATTQTTAATAYNGFSTVVFGSTTTWAVPAGITRARITVIAGGGGARTGTSDASGGQGGAAVAYCTGLSGTLTITIGAGGNGANNANGVAGGTSSVTGTGVSISCTGGGAGGPGGAGVRGARGVGTVTTGTTLKRSISGTPISNTQNIAMMPPLTSGIEAYTYSGSSSATAVAWAESTNTQAGYGGDSGAVATSGGCGGAVMIEY
jgi:hypothetical protein